MARSDWYRLLVGVAVGTLCTGLLLPFAVGDSGARGDGGSELASIGELPQKPPAGVAPPAPGASSGAPTAASATSDPASADTSTQRLAAQDPAGAIGAGGTVRRASDRGVTADRIKLGFLLIDVGGLGQIGIAVGITVEQQRAAVSAYVDELNDAGGIAGRRVEAVQRPVNLLKADDGRAACLQLTQDAEVFAAAGNVQVPADALCYAREHKTPVLASNAFPDSVYASGGGLVNSLQMRGGRLMRNWVFELDRIGYLRGRRVGIVTSEGGDPNSETARQLRGFLEGAGHSVVYMARLAEDLHTGSSQIPVELSQMRAAGAEVVLLMANVLFNQQWAQEADSQRWRPQYSVSGWSNSDSDNSTDNMPDSYEGTVGFTSLWPGAGTAPDTPEPPTMRACRETYELRSGRKLAARGSNEYGVTMVYCDLVKVLAAQISATGPNPTRAAIPTTHVAGMDPLGWIRGGTLSPGRPDAANYLRMHRWQANCHCYRPLEDFRKTPF